MAESRLLLKLFQRLPQFFSALGIRHVDVGNHAVDVGGEVGVTFGVLCFEPGGFGVVEDGAEAAVGLAGSVGAGVDDDSGDFLAAVLPLHAGLLFVDDEFFFPGDVAQGGEDHSGFLCWFAAGGEGHIVRVAGVGPAVFVSETGEPEIQFSCGNVAQSWTGGGSLRKGAGADGDVQFRSCIIHELPWALGAEEGEDGGDAGAVTQGLKDAFDARKGDCGEEVFEVRIDDHVLADVRDGVAHDVAFVHESMGGIVHGDAPEDRFQNPTLSTFEFDVGRGEFTCATGLFGDLESDVMRNGGGVCVEGEPPEFGDWDFHGLGQILWSGEDREGEAIELFDVRAAVRQTSGNSPSEENDVGDFPLRNGFGALQFSCGDFCFALLFASFAGGLVGGHGEITTLPSGGWFGAGLLILDAGFVDLLQLFRGQ